ncbi:arsenate reductase family protein [Planomonospora sp. ID91781]|uniref:Arsenate reductase n=2 Tax=Planomonospora parontospora TaxID=58119 RepID=A0AA37F2E3_9ACTN|nr:MULTISPECIES: ArsC/Spx/MgsR family protein [Planomonospora]MBG0821997.1 arsenate reductase family protein [Planomonospora sp. ID91781]GGK47279.1 arsenate reductase [Planomonospora parontospora]GII06581.1 arsenate reductase [Planomonospora parontospora subsp. parontospora]
MTTVWHNPRCSKSRCALDAFAGVGRDVTVRRYLDDPPTVAELTEVLDRLGLQPWDVTRMGEARARELGLAERPRDRDEWIALLAADPVLIQRPIVLTDDGRAVIARDEETLKALLEDGS